MIRQHKPADRGRQAGRPVLLCPPMGQICNSSGPPFRGPFRPKAGRHLPRRSALSCWFLVETVPRVVPRGREAASGGSVCGGGLNCYTLIRLSRQNHCCPRHWRRRHFPQHKHLIPPVSAAPPKGRLAGGRSVLSEAPTEHLTTTVGRKPRQMAGSRLPNRYLLNGEAPATPLPVQFDNFVEAVLDNSDAGVGWEIG